MIVYRYHVEGKDKEYAIKDKNNIDINNKEILDYINNLVIPPAYRNVKIFIEKSPKILYEGYDDKGRKQQIYSPSWTKKASKKKFQELALFGKLLPKIYLDINKNIENIKITKNKVISLILKIISVCYFRIGNSKYQKLYGSYGISNIKKRHITLLKNNLIEIKFIGKKGIENQCIIKDKIIINELRNIYNTIKPEDYIFTYIENGEHTIIKAIDINNWLKEYHESFTSKMFRTFDTNTLLLDFLKKAHVGIIPNPSDEKITTRKKNIVNAMKEISNCVNNTPAICKKSYANEDIINMYINNPKKYEKEFFNSNTARVNFINFLKKNYVD
jgi:DNA topoisomerase I